MFVDPHEIANVFGLPGVKLMVDEAAVQPIHVWVPNSFLCSFSTWVRNARREHWPEGSRTSVYLARNNRTGEMMNFPGVIAGDENMHSEMAITRAVHKVIGGHYPTPDLGPAFHAYVAGGADDDHEGTTMEDAAARPPGHEGDAAFRISLA